MLPKKKKKKKTTIEDYSDKEKLYKTRPIQIKSPDDITNEERVKFYKSFIKLKLQKVLQAARQGAEIYHLRDGGESQ